MPTAGRQGDEPVGRGKRHEIRRAGPRQRLGVERRDADRIRNIATLGVNTYGWTFSVRGKGARVGRNPKTGEEVPISPRRVLSFRPSHLMKDRVAAGAKG